MCGLVGIIGGAGEFRGTETHRVVRRMASTLSHRGPDDEGVWWDDDAGVVLGHRRLAIVDLSPAGHQPMLSSSGRFVIAYNGEIYNFPALRRELVGLGSRFRGNSDTEVLLDAIETWGVEVTLDRINGMFAFALWDRPARTLHLVRDRLGKKPLYFGRTGRSFLFGSELKAFHAHPDFIPELDRGAVALLLRYSYVPSPYSIYRGVFKLPPAGHLALSTEQCISCEPPLTHLRIYWSLREAIERGIKRPLELPDEEAVGRLEGLLTEAVEQRMLADVPLGAFLSGGIDSSTVVALMQKCSTSPIKTFTIGFHQSGYNEAEAAMQVAQHLGTKHQTFYVTPRDAQAVIPSLATIYDEPFADTSQIPTFLVAQLTRRHVTVALSGDGGDEIFAGYSRHFLGPHLWRAISFCPGLLRRGCAGLLTSISPERWDAGFEYMNRWLPPSRRRPMPGYHLHKLAALLVIEDPEHLYERLVSRWTDPSSTVTGSDEPRLLFRHPKQHPHLDDITHRMMYYDTISYLPDGILVKVDRASMASSLEVRAPLLDYRIAEFAWQLPREMKVRRGAGKWILRQILARYVPIEFVDRPKQGFVIPVDHWLRGPLRDWADAMLDERRLRTEGVFEPGPIRQKWEEHLTGKGNWIDPLWCILMFQTWLEKWRSCPSQRSATTHPGGP